MTKELNGTNKKDLNKIDNSGFLEIINSAIDNSPDSMADIARKAGFPNRTSIYQIKDGKMKLALARVPRLAAALNISPRLLFVKALEQYFTGETIDLILSSVFDVTAREMEIIDFIRMTSQNSDPKLTSALMNGIKEGLSS